MSDIRQLPPLAFRIIFSGQGIEVAGPDLRRIRFENRFRHLEDRVGLRQPVGLKSVT